MIVTSPCCGVTEQLPSDGGRLVRNENSTTDSYEPGVDVVRTRL